MTLDNSLYYVLIVYTRATKNSMFSLGSFTKDLRQAVHSAEYATITLAQGFREDFIGSKTTYTSSTVTRILSTWIHTHYWHLTQCLLSSYFLCGLQSLSSFVDKW